MTPYYNTLPAAVQKNLAPLLPVMRQAANANGIPVDLLISIAAKESGGRNVEGDKKLKQTAKGIYQIRDAKFWTGGVDPRDSVAATPALAQRLASVYAECGGDAACVHFKYMSGQNRKYDPATVARISAKQSHVMPRLQDVAKAFGGPEWLSAGAKPTKQNAQPTSSPARQALAMTPPPPPVTYSDPYAALLGGAQDVPPPEAQQSFTGQIADIFGSTGAPAASGVKSAPYHNMFGLANNE